MDKVKIIIGKLSRILAVLTLTVLSFITLLMTLFSLLSKELYQISQIVSVFYKIFSVLFLVVFIYGIYLLIKNNRKYLKLFGYFLPAYCLFLTIYRFFFITNGQFENADLTNLLIYLAPLILIIVSYKLEPIKIEGIGNNLDNLSMPVIPINEPFSPLQYQSFIIRGAAYIIDQILFMLPLVLIASLLKTEPENSKVYMIIGEVLFLVYLIIAEATWGQTLGKKLFGIKVMMKNGGNCTVLGAVLRNVFRVVDMIFGGYLLAIIVMIITPKKQRIGDLIARTVVVKL